MSKHSWIQINGQLIPKEEYYGQNTRSSVAGYTILKDIEPFISPVDGKIINSRSQLRVHNKQHDVTNMADFSPEYVEKKVKERQLRLHGQTRADKQDRIEALKRAYESQPRR